MIRELGHVLQHLYDPLELSRSPLPAQLGLPERASSGVGLQETLIAAIQSLRPSPAAPAQAGAQRLYHILLYRFVEQLPQKEVARDLGLSIRQLRRLEDDAIDLLADTLRRRYGQPASVSPGKADSVPVDKRDQELDWLRRTVPSESVALSGLIEQALRTAEPVLVAASISASFTPPPQPVVVLCQATPLRQALLNLLTTAGQTAPAGKVDIHIQTEATRGHARICLEITSAGACDEYTWQESIDITRQLLGVVEGTLTVDLNGRRRRITIGLPLAEQAVVLAIDDNPDALQLLERALAGSPYRLIAAPAPGQAIEIAARHTPRAIVLDVMMPGVDGWEMLGRLRAHPLTAGVPVIVTTILPQESLALALGAAAFLRKPISRETLLQTLDAVARESPAAPQ